METGDGGRLGSGVSIHDDVAEAEEGGEELTQNWLTRVRGRDCGGTAGVAVALREYLMSLSCSSGEGRLTGSINQS